MGSQMKRLFSQEHYFFRLKKQKGVICCEEDDNITTTNLIPGCTRRFPVSWKPVCHGAVWSRPVRKYPDIFKSANFLSQSPEIPFFDNVFLRINRKQLNAMYTTSPTSISTLSNFHVLGNHFLSVKRAGTLHRTLYVLEGTRTLNLRLRRATPYPLGHKDLRSEGERYCLI